MDANPFQTTGNCQGRRRDLYSAAMNVSHLLCSACEKKFEARRLYNLCDCGKPLLVQYDLEVASQSMTKEKLRERAPNLWRYREVLPVDDPKNILCLGEGV